MDKPTEKQLRYLKQLRAYFNISAKIPKTKQEATKEVDKLVFRLEVSGKCEDFKRKTFGESYFESDSDRYMEEDYGCFWEF